MFDAGKLLQDFSDAEAIALARIIAQENANVSNDLNNLGQAVTAATYIIEQDFGPYRVLNARLKGVDVTRQKLDTLMRMSLEEGRDVPRKLSCNTAFVESACATALALYDANVHQEKFVGDPDQLREAIRSFTTILAAVPLELA